MRKKWIWRGGALIVVVCLVLGFFFILRPFMFHQIERSMLASPKPGVHVPSDFGVAYTALQCPSGSNVLNAYRVDAGKDTPALLIYSGDGQNASDWSEVQAYLAKHGLSTMVFDYAGVGKSTGIINYENLNQDAGAAWRCFRKSFGNARARFAAGYSLGTAVLLNNVHAFEVKPKAIVVYGAFTSVKKLLTYFGVAAYQLPLLPNVWDSVHAARHLRNMPLFVEAGANDCNVPPVMGRQIAISANANFNLVWGARHDGIVTDITPVWTPILKFFNAQLHTDKWSGPRLQTNPDVPNPANRF